jgi:hypothetical protein
VAAAVAKAAPLKHTARNIIPQHKEDGGRGEKGTVRSLKKDFGLLIGSKVTGYN